MDSSGVIFTLPALIFLGFDLEYTRIFLLALLGGLLGVLFMIPLRRQLIVEEHGRLAYPEGTACADVLLAGERGGSFAGRVFLGLGLGGLYTFFQNENLFRRVARHTRTDQPQWFREEPPFVPTSLRKLPGRGLRGRLGPPDCGAVVCRAGSSPGWC